MNDVSYFCFITNLVLGVFIGAMLLIIPALTRKSYLFGVKIPIEEQSSPGAQALKKRYRSVCAAGTVILLALMLIQYFVFPKITLVSVMYFPLLFIAVQMTAYVPCWKRAGMLKTERGWRVTGAAFAETKSSHSRGHLSELPWLWYIISIILAVAVTVVTFAKYPSLPDRIPTHYDFNMQPDAWADKSISSLMTMPLICAATVLLMWLVGVMTVRAKLQLDPQNPALSFAQHRIYRRRMGNSLGFLTLGMVIMFAAIGAVTIWPELHVSFWIMLAAPVGIPTIVIVAASVLSGQGGCRIKPKTISDTGVERAAENSERAPGRGDDKYWALGMFYHNPEDPAYIVEDRFGGNLGFNYSRLPIKLCVAAGMLAFVALYVWITILMSSGRLS